MLQYNNISRQLPHTGYIKGIDVWMLVAMLWISLMMAEFSVLVYKYRKYGESSSSLLSTKDDDEDENDRQDTPVDSIRRLAGHVDFWFRLVSGIAYVMFLVVYFWYSVAKSG